MPQHRLGLSNSIPNEFIVLLQCSGGVFFMGLFTALVVGGVIYGITQLISNMSSGNNALKNDSNFEQYRRYLANNLQTPNHYLTYTERQSIATDLTEKGTVNLGVDCAKYRGETLSLLDNLNNNYYQGQHKDIQT